MSGTHRSCEICGIKERHSSEKLFFARFPLDKDRCAKWIKSIGKEDLAYLPIEKLHSSRHVCGNHFIKRDFTKTKTRLKKHAIPTVNLKSAPLTDNIIAEFFQLNSHVPILVSQQNKAPSAALATSSANEQADSAQNIHSTTQSTNQTTHDEPMSTEVIQQQLPCTTPIASANINEQPVTSVASTSQTRCNQLFPDKLKAQPSRKRPLATSTIHNLNDLAVPSSSQPLSNSKNIGKRWKISEADNNTTLNPREADLLKQLQQAKATIKSLNKSAKLIDAIQSPVLKEIVNMALKNQKRKPKGRRWTTKNKISLLAIFKRSPKAYRYLQHLMPMPSINTLQNILKKIPVEPGICQHALDYLKKQLPKNRQDKYCCLLFDEIAIKPRLVYNNATDKVEGFTDMGNGERSSELADHALVFMLQGLKRKYKQPIAFYFVKGTVSSNKLATLIREIIIVVMNAGYNVLATVCDQGPTNMGALKILKQLSIYNENEFETKNYFKVENKTIYVIYDVPHLFKSIRNNFLNYGIMKMDGKTANWDHLIKVEDKNRSLLYLSKVSQTHIQPKYRAKMKVKYAAQILSNTVAAVLKLLALAEKTPSEAQEIMETAIIVQSLDKLFDFTNGPSGPDDIKKGQRENVSAKTNHAQVWLEYRKILETVTFLKPQTGIKSKNVRCIQGYITTLCSLRDIWNEFEHLGFKYLNLRQLNQDSLENLFGVIRQHSPTNKNPTVASFIGALKTTIISKMTAPHSRGSNCQKDSNHILTDFHDLIFGDKDCTEDSTREDDDNRKTLEDAENYPVLSIPDIEEEEANLFNIETQPVVYLSGYVAHCILKKITCDACSEALIIKNPDDVNNVYEYIKLREWWQDKTSLTYPSESLCRYIHNNINVFEKDVMTSVHFLNICTLTTTLFMSHSDASFIKCSVHHDIMVNLILTRLAQLLIRRQCTRINKRISAEEENLQDLIKQSQQRGINKNVI